MAGISPSTGQAKSIKHVGLFAVVLYLLSFIVWPIVTVLIWIILTRKYHRSIIGRVCTYIVFGIGGSILLLLGYVGKMDVSFPDWPVLITAAIVLLVPFAHTYIRSLEW